MLQPRPGLPLAVALREKALQGLPLALSTEPALLSSALHSSRHLHESLRTALLLLSLQTPSSPLAFSLTRVFLTETGWPETNQAEMKLGEANSAWDTTPCLQETAIHHLGIRICYPSHTQSQIALTVLLPFN